MIILNTQECLKNIDWLSAVRLMGCSAFDAGLPTLQALNQKTENETLSIHHFIR